MQLEDCPDSRAAKIGLSSSGWAATVDLGHGNANVGRPAWKPARLRFTMKDADLYSIRFTKQEAP